MAWQNVKHISVGLRGKQIYSHTRLTNRNYAKLPYQAAECTVAHNCGLIMLHNLKNSTSRVCLLEFYQLNINQYTVITRQDEGRVKRKHKLC